MGGGGWGRTDFGDEEAWWWRGRGGGAVVLGMGGLGREVSGGADGFGDEEEGGFFLLNVGPTLTYPTWR